MSAMTWLLVGGILGVRGDVIEVFPASTGENAVRIEFFGDEIDRDDRIQPPLGRGFGRRLHIMIFPLHPTM